MINMTAFITTNKHLFASMLIYMTLGTILIPYVQYQINLDGIMYISVAKEYLAHEYIAAINGFRGPLLSWLLIPFMFFGVSPLISAKILLLLIGFATIISFRNLSFRFDITESYRNILIYSIIPVIIYFAFIAIVPDLLLMTAIAFYLSIIFNHNYSTRPGYGFLCGLLGAIAYLSKNYAFPFFIIHFFVFNVIHFTCNKDKEKRWNIIRNFFIGFTLFLFISGSWILTISIKYQKLTIGTVGAFVHAGSNPDIGIRDKSGLKEPYFKTSICYGEDPSYVPIKSWNPFSSWHSLKHQIKVTLKNTYAAYLVLLRFTPFSIAIISLYILFCVTNYNNKRLFYTIEFFCLLTIFLYASGYLLLYIEERYLWIIYLMIILMGGSILSLFLKDSFFQKRNVRVIVIILFILSFVAMPIKDLYSDINEKAYKHSYDLSKVLKNQFNVHGNIASNSGWGDSLILSFHLGCRYFGTVNKKWSSEELRKNLQLFNIDYYVVWKDNQFDNNVSELPYKDITFGQVSGLAVYAVKSSE